MLYSQLYIGSTFRDILLEHEADILKDLDLNSLPPMSYESYRLASSCQFLPIKEVKLFLTEGCSIPN